MEKLIYILIILSGVRVVYNEVVELFGSWRAYKAFTRNGFCPSEMDIECTCPKCTAIADAMTPEELESDKRDHYHFVKDKLWNQVMDELCYVVFYVSIVIFAVIKYIN